jgi:nitroreductase
MEFRELLRRRRMVRSFTDEPVPVDAVGRIVDTARRGPSAGYSQGVEFVVVTDEAMRKAVAGDEAPYRRAGMPPFVAQAPVQVVICTSAAIYTGRYAEADKQAATAGRADDDFWHVPYWHVDAGCALMLLLLATVDEGLAAGFVGVMGEQRQQRLRELLGIPPEYMAIGIAAIGHEAADARQYRGSAARRPRRPLAEIMHRERW